MKDGQRREEPEAKKPTVPEEPVVLTVPQAARLLQVSENHLYSLIGQDAIPHLRFGKLIRIPRWGLLKHIEIASGTPIPVNFDVALVPDQSVDGEQTHPVEG